VGRHPCWRGQPLRPGVARRRSCRGVDGGSSPAFAGLSDLLTPLVERLPFLPEPQAHALAVSLALSPGIAGPPLAASAGCLRLLCLAAEHQPLVVLIDDHQWLDDESAHILSFVVRRISNDPIAVLLAVREEPDVHNASADLPVIRVCDLSRDECAALADRLGVPVGQHDLDDLMDRTGGNGPGGGGGAQADIGEPLRPAAPSLLACPHLGPSLGGRPAPDPGRGASGGPGPRVPRTART